MITYNLSKVIIVTHSLRVVPGKVVARPCLLLPSDASEQTGQKRVRKRNYLRPHSGLGWHRATFTNEKKSSTTRRGSDASASSRSPLAEDLVFLVAGSYRCIPTPCIELRAEGPWLRDTNYQRPDRTWDGTAPPAHTKVEGSRHDATVTATKRQGGYSCVRSRVRTKAACKSPLPRPAVPGPSPAPALPLPCLVLILSPPALLSAPHPPKHQKSLVSCFHFVFM